MKLFDGFIKNQIRDCGKTTARGRADAAQSTSSIPNPFPPSGPFRMLDSLDQPVSAVDQPTLPGTSTASFGQPDDLFETTPW